MNTDTKKKINFIVGGDPEFPLYDNEYKKFISLVPYVKGTKDQPLEIPVNGCFQQIDNVGIEFNIPPSHDFMLYHRGITDCIEYTNKWLQEYKKDWELKIVSSAEYDSEQLDSETAMKFGCEPSFSVYTQSESYRPDPEDIGGLRSFSYHLHFGFDTDLTVEDRDDFLLLCDLFLGIPSYFIDPDKDRRLIYGNLSDHRVKSDSRVEYRVLGAGMHNHPNFVYNGIEMLRKHLNEDFREIVKEFYEELWDINESNYDEELINDLKNKLIEKNLWNQEN